MADIPPANPGIPGGAVPPMKKSTGRVQPKKETVRINLPPKPTAAPTIKLPTLPPGGPTGAPSAMPMPSAGGLSTARPGAPRSAAAPVAQARSAPVSQRAAAPATAPTVGTLDKILAISAMVAALFAVGSVLYLMFGISIGE